MWGLPNSPLSRVPFWIKTPSYTGQDFGDISFVSSSNSEAMLSGEGAILKPKTKGT